MALHQLNIRFVPDHIDHIMERGGIPRIRELATSGIYGRAINLQALSLLSNLFCGSKSQIEYILEFQVLPVLFQKLGSKDMKMVSVAICALANMCTSDEEYRDLLLSNLLIESISSLFILAPDNDEVILNVVNLLNNLIFTAPAIRVKETEIMTILSQSLLYLNRPKGITAVLNLITSIVRESVGCHEILEKSEYLMAGLLHAANVIPGPVIQLILPLINSSETARHSFADAKGLSFIRRQLEGGSMYSRQLLTLLYCYVSNDEESRLEVSTRIGLMRAIGGYLKKDEKVVKIISLLLPLISSNETALSSFIQSGCLVAMLEFARSIMRSSKISQLSLMDTLKRFFEALQVASLNFPALIMHAVLESRELLVALSHYEEWAPTINAVLSIKVSLKTRS